MVQAVLDTLGSSSFVEANCLPGARGAWGAGGGVGGSQADTVVAASLVQRLDWQEMAFTLPGHPATFLRVAYIASYYCCLCSFC